MNIQMQKIGDRIRAARNAKGLTQEQLAEKLNVTFQAVSNWENGNCLPDTDRLPDLAEQLDISLDILLTEEDVPDWEMKPVNNDPEHMFTFVKGRAQMLHLTQTLAVLGLLRQAHEKQLRNSKTGFTTTYMVHPLTMACHALAMNLRDDDVLAAVLAHDMVEDGGFLPEDLPVNDRVRNTVRLVSKNLLDKSAPDWEKRYYEAIRQDPLACLVKCLDRTNNLAGMSDAFTRKKMAEYTAETDRYYPPLLEVLKKIPEWNDAWWLIRYQMTSQLETYKRLFVR